MTAPLAGIGRCTRCGDAIPSTVTFNRCQPCSHALVNEECAAQGVPRFINDDGFYARFRASMSFPASVVAVPDRSPADLPLPATSRAAGSGTATRAADEPAAANVRGSASRRSPAALPTRGESEPPRHHLGGVAPQPTNAASPRGPRRKGAA